MEGRDAVGGTIPLPPGGDAAAARLTDGAFLAVGHTLVAFPSASRREAIALPESQKVGKGGGVPLTFVVAPWPRPLFLRPSLAGAGAIPRQPPAAEPQVPVIDGPCREAAGRCRATVASTPPVPRIRLRKAAWMQAGAGARAAASRRAILPGASTSVLVRAAVGALPKTRAPSAIPEEVPTAASIAQAVGSTPRPIGRCRCVVPEKPQR